MSGYFCGTFPSSESTYPTGRDPQHIISEDSTALAVHRDWGPQMLSAKDRDKQAEHPLERAHDSFYTPHCCKGTVCLFLVPHEVQDFRM